MTDAGAPSGDIEALRARRERRLAAFVVVAPAIAVVAAAALFARGIRPTPADLAIFAVGSLLTMIGVEIGYHRYFTHRSFEAPPPVASLLGALGSTAFLGPVLWWATIHRRHHAHADRNGDPHSPHWPHRGVRGLVHSHVGWLFDPAFTAMSLSAGKLKDLWSDPCAVRVQRTYLLWGALGIAAPAALGGACGGARGALMGVLWGGLGRVFVVSHLVWAINSLGHRLGTESKRAHAGRARNNLALALPTLGGGFHASHHESPRAYTTRAAWWQLDPAGALLWLFARAGVITNLKTRATRSPEA